MYFTIRLRDRDFYEVIVAGAKARVESEYKQSIIAKAKLASNLFHKIVQKREPEDIFWKILAKKTMKQIANQIAAFVIVYYSFY